MSKSNKPFNRFEEFRSIIESSDDTELMKVCQGLLRDVIKINDMEELLEKARAALYEEKKRQFFSFFVEGLPPLEVAALADKCSGRVKILEKRDEKQKEKEAPQTP
jgi:DNA-directed RNA polymerase specialized sigma24 family protein